MECVQWQAANSSHPDQRKSMKKKILAVLWVLTASGLGLSCANAQVKWEQDSGRPWSWIEGHMFWNELTQSVDDFLATRWVPF